jgi:hypothetical protein
LLFALAALCAQAQVYKWVDDKGQVHYGEQPPPEAKTSTVNVPAPGPATPAPGTAAAAAEKPKLGADGKTAYDMPKEKSERCKYEKEQLEILKGDDPVSFTNDKKESDLLVGDKRVAARKLVEENVKKYCS